MFALKSASTARHIISQSAAKYTSPFRLRRPASIIPLLGPSALAAAGFSFVVLCGSIGHQFPGALLTRPAILISCQSSRMSAGVNLRSSCIERERGSVAFTSAESQVPVPSKSPSWLLTFLLACLLFSLSYSVT